jgi:RNA polymerase sigma-70 factor (ECF subfamily)
VYLAMDGDDAALVGRCLQGDQNAFRSLVERYHGPLYRLAARMLGNSEDAKDATQDAFVSAYEHLASYDPRHRFFSWIYRILVNDCLNVLRARRPVETLDPLLAGDDDPFSRVESGEMRDRVRTALLRLTDEQREVILLRHFAELSYREIADATDVPEKTVKSRLFAARQRLGELLLPAGAVR